MFYSEGLSSLPSGVRRTYVCRWYVVVHMIATRTNVCQSRTPKEGAPASFWVGSLCLEEDDFRLESEDPGTQRLLVVGQDATLLTFRRQVLL